MEWVINYSSKKFVNVYAESISQAIEQAIELMPSETITSVRTMLPEYRSLASQSRFDLILNRVANYQWMMTRDIDALTVMARATDPELLEAINGLRAANSEIGNAIPQVSLHSFRYSRRSRRHAGRRSGSSDAQN